MAAKIIKAQITTKDEKGHIRHHTEQSKNINWKKLAEELGGTPPVMVTKEKKTTPKKKD